MYKKSCEKISLAGCVLLTLVSVPLVPAFAQTQAQQDRLNRVAQFVVTSPMCARLGMKLDSDLPTKAGAAFETETASWKIDSTTLDRLTREAVSRQSAILKTDLQTAADGADTEAELRGLRATLLQYGQTCITATTDPIFSKLIITPANYDLEKAATDAADAMLEAGDVTVTVYLTPKLK